MQCRYPVIFTRLVHLFLFVCYFILIELQKKENIIYRYNIILDLLLKKVLKFIKKSPRRGVKTSIYYLFTDTYIFT